MRLFSLKEGKRNGDGRELEGDVGTWGGDMKSRFYADGNDPAGKVN